MARGSSGDAHHLRVATARGILLIMLWGLLPQGWLRATTCIGTTCLRRKELMAQMRPKLGDADLQRAESSGAAP